MKIIIPLLLILLLPSLIIAEEFPLAGNWFYQERGGVGSGGSLGTVYYPKNLDIISPAISINISNEENAINFKNIKNEIGIIPQIMIWEHDTTQTFQFQLFHVWLDTPVDTNFTWGDMRKYFFFKIESLDGKTTYHLPYNFGDPNEKLVLRNTYEIAHLFFYSYNQLPIPFGVNEPFRVTLQIHETPDSSGTVFKQFAPHTVSRFNPTTVQDSIVWAYVTWQDRRNPNRLNMYKSFAEQMPHSVDAQISYLSQLKKAKEWDTFESQYIYVLGLIENKIDSTKPVNFNILRPVTGNNDSYTNEEEYFNQFYINLLRSYYNPNNN